MEYGVGKHSLRQLPRELPDEAWKTWEIEDGGGGAFAASTEASKVKAQRLYMDIGFAKLDELYGDDLVFGKSIST